MKQAGGTPKWNAIQEPGSWQQPSLAKQRPKLIDGHKKRDEIDRAQNARDDEAAQPVIGSREPVCNGHSAMESGSVGQFLSWRWRRWWLGRFPRLVILIDLGLDLLGLIHISASNAVVTLPI